MPIAAPVSVIDLPPENWADALRRHALKAARPVDEAALLDWFRAHSEFYRQRIGRAQQLADVPPLEKTELADVPVLPGEDLRATRSSGTSGFSMRCRRSCTRSCLSMAHGARHRTQRRSASSMGGASTVPGSSVLRLTPGPRGACCTRCGRR